METLEGIDIDSAVAQAQSGDLSDMPVWDVCLTYKGASYKTLQLAAPSPEDAATTMGQIVALLNQQAQAKGYEPAFGWAIGVCPA
ncbi:hypothetical protein LJ655_00880 [Paraburkholderia sp. MMS20-SJTN17]|uniref:Uncharacterized protein n=1 Tax=Paraburkholderia translucens TaxID=2886945 RepID=A0ABS8K705_9BURK|nr:hypothetical protein [Paraburkholderia sp. MMS20-SJTN17]MCC8400457.1 hypothetical protein [Paraburkholderia sp. MMS20-SJTN17]